MANTVLANMSIVLGANIKGFERNMAVARKNLQGFAQMGDRLKDVGQSMSLYLTAPLTLVGGLALKAAGDMDALRKGLAAVAGSSEAANEQFERLKEVAKLPGLGLEEAVKGSIRLQSIGMAASDAERSIKVFGNAVATVGGGRVELERAIYGLQQLANTKFPLGEDLNIVKDAIPQITPLLNKAFGTARSDELAKLGITSKQVVDTVLAGLEQLPPVAGGINNAFENLRDAAMQSLSSIGTAINETFNVEGLATRFADMLTSMADKFSALSPVAKGAILVIGGLVAAAGPLALAIGSVASALPLLSVGFAALTGPIGIAVAAVAGAAALIISNWDTIRDYFTTGGGAAIFSKVVAVASQAMEMVKAIISRFIKWGTLAWDTFGGALVGFATYAWDNIKGVISTALDIIGGVLEVFTNLWNGNWQGLWDSMLNLGKIAVNALIDLVAGIVTAIPRMFNEVFKGLGIENAFTRGLDNSLKAVRAFVEQVKFDTKGVGENLQQELTVTTPGPDASAPAPTTTTITGGNEQLKKTQEIISDLQKQFNLAADQFAVFGSSFDVVGSKAKSLEGAINSLLENGISPQSALIQGLKAQFDSLNTISLEGLKNTFDDAARGIANNVLAIGTQVQQIPSIVVPVIDELSAKFNSFVEQSVPMIHGALVDAFAGIGAAIGEAATGASISLGNMASMILMPLADMAVQVGKVAIGVGIGIEGIKKALLSLNPAAALAAGAALIALGSIAKSALSKAASGGSVAPRASGGGFSSPTPNQNIGTGRKQNTLYTKLSGRELWFILEQESDFVNRAGGRRDR